MAFYRAEWHTSAGSGGPLTVSTPAVGDLLVIVCSVLDGPTSDLVCTDNNADGLGTYYRVGHGHFSVEYTDAHELTKTWNSELNVFIREALIGSATSTVVTLAKTGSDDAAITALAISGAMSAGATAVRQSAFQTAQAAGTTAAPTLPAAALTANMTIAGVGSFDDTTTPPTDWTERTDHKYNNYSYPQSPLSVETCTRDNGFTGTTVTFGAAQSEIFASFALELVTAGGRYWRHRRHGFP